MKKQYVPIILFLVTVIIGLGRWKWPMLSDNSLLIITVFFWIAISAFIITTVITFWSRLIRLVQRIPFRIRFERKPKIEAPEAELRDAPLTRPDLLIFPYLQTVSASPIENGKDYLSVRFCFPSALPYDLRLTQVRGYLTINGTPTEEQEMRRITVLKQSFNEITDLHIPLMPDLKTVVQDCVKRCNPVTVHLKLTGWDIDDKEYDLSTREWTTLLVTRIN